MSLDRQQVSCKSHLAIAVSMLHAPGALTIGACPESLGPWCPAKVGHKPMSCCKQPACKFPATCCGQAYCHKPIKDYVDKACFLRCHGRAACIIRLSCTLPVGPVASALVLTWRECWAAALGHNSLWTGRPLKSIRKTRDGWGDMENLITSPKPSADPGSRREAECLSMLSCAACCGRP